MSIFQTVVFSEEDIVALKSIIEIADEVSIQVKREMSGIWFHSDDWESQLRLLILGNFRVTISRASFRNRRRGTMTSVLRYLKEFCQKHDMKEIVVQSVESREMVNWCQKNGFVPNPYASMLIKGILLGDYKLLLES